MFLRALYAVRCLLAWRTPAPVAEVPFALLQALTATPADRTPGPEPEPLRWHGDDN